MAREFEIAIQDQTFTVSQENNAVQFYVNGNILEQ